MAVYSLLYLNILLLGRYVTSSPLGDSCYVSNYWDIAAAAQNCDTLTLGDIVIPEQTTLQIALRTGARLIFDGHLTHVPAEWTGDLIQITGTNVEVSGTDRHVLDGLGPKHWKGANEPTIMRPKFLRLKLKNSQVKDLYLKNCPNNCMMIQSSDLVISNILVDNKDGYPAVAGSKFAKNTDGFDIGSSSNVRVINSVVYNQDDCVAVNGGHDYVFDNLFCNGSHGFSFSVKNGDVYNVKFRNSHIEYSNNAIHIKTHNDGEAGSIRNVLYSNITFTGIDRYAISIQENYPSGAAKANIPITNLTLTNIQGSMTGSKSMAQQIVCAKNGCSDWKFSGINIVGAKNKNQCENVPSGISC